MPELNSTSPVYFPSISSSSKTRWEVDNFVELLITLKYPQFLVSCYDLFYSKNKEHLLYLLKSAVQNQFILLDSGIYEQVWNKSNDWNNDYYNEIISHDIFSEAFSFDSYFLNKKSIELNDIYQTIENSIEKTGKTNISPIIHNNGEDTFINVSMEILEKKNPLIIAFPERELGKGVIEITKKIVEIRKEINKINPKQIIHILGTGNPISIMLYYFAGANTFDGLDWCQTVVDFDTAKLHHYQHLDFYRNQSESGNDLSFSFMTRCFLHNLEFYTRWLDELGTVHTKEAKSYYINKYLPNESSKEYFLELLCK